MVEIFCAQGNDPVAKWKLSGGAIHKVTEEGFIVFLCHRLLANNCFVLQTHR